MKEIIKHKLPYLLFFLLLFSSFASIHGQERTITLNFSKVPLKTALKEIEKQSSMSVVYNTNDVDINRAISIKVSKEPLANVVDQLFKGTNISFSIVDKHIVLSTKGSEENLQKKPQFVTSGTIKDAQGEPLIGVSVLVKGTSNGTITDIDGNFNIQAAKGDVLEISYVGYTSQTITLANAQALRVVLNEDTKVLDEVVVTALGIKRSQKALSYNVQQINSDELNTVKDANFVNSLSGKVAGVTINASSSGIGGATRVVMRGTKSITANNNALYVIDGVPLFNSNKGATEGEYSGQPGGESISDINPEDIESMSVLSGPAAAALYGSNAAAGVILITTKKGQEGKVKVTISNNSTFSSPFVMPEFQNTYANRPGEYMSWGNKMDHPSSYDPKNFFNTGTNIQNNISLSVGSAKSQSYLSVGTTNANGIITNNSYDRYNFNFRNTTKFLNDKLTLDASVNYVKQRDKNLMAQGEYWNPLIDVYLFPRGEDFDDIRLYERFDEGRQIFVQHWPWKTRQNPYWIANRNIRTNKKDRYMLNASLKYDLADWINISGRIRVDNSNNDFEDKRYASTEGLFAGEKGFYKSTKANDKQTYGDILININKTFKDFSFSANIGGSGTYLSNDESGLQGALKDMPNLFTYKNIDLKEGRDSYPIQSGWEECTLSLFASAEIGWKSMLYLTVTGRNDWASGLAGTEQPSFFYPSVGLSAVLSEMIKLPTAISYLKIRGSWASVGSSVPRGIAAQKSSFYKWDPATGKWATNTFRPLGKLYPERTDSWEAGVSTKLFGNRISFDATWYKSNTSNQTFNIPVSASSGYSSMYVQSGSVENWGMEFSLGLNNTFGDFRWNSAVTYSFNRNKVVELLDDYFDPLTNEHYSLPEFGAGGVGSLSYRLTKGGTMGDIYVDKELKRDQEGNIWIESNNVVVIKKDKPEKVGSVLPKGNLGFRNDFNYKNFNLGFLLTARFGGEVVSVTQAVMDENGVSKVSADVRDQDGIFINRGQIEAEKYYSVTGGKSGLLDNYIYSATNARLQEAYIGYAFPGKWFNDKCNISCSIIGRNLFMIYKKAPFDPEATASTGTYFQGLDLYMQPSLRSFGFNVKVEF